MARQTVDPPAVGEQRLRMTYEEYLACTDEDTWMEWVDGELVAWERKTLAHQELLGLMVVLLGLYARARNLGEVLPLVGVHLPSRPSLRLPDVVFVADAHRDRLTPTVIEGPPDLIVEVVSDDSVRRDQVNKRDEYAAAGVPEYWWLDPRPGQQLAGFHRLTAGATYEPIPLDAAGRFVSVVLSGFWLDPAWLWQDPLPDPLALIKRIAPEALRASLLAPDADDTAAIASRDVR